MVTEHRFMLTGHFQLLEMWHYLLSWQISSGLIACKFYLAYSVACLQLLIYLVL